MSASFWGALIIKLREEQQLSQRSLSVLANVNRATLRRMETGAALGEVVYLERLLNTLGYELDAFQSDNRPRELPDAYRTPERRSKLAVSRILSLDLT